LSSVERLVVTQVILTLLPIRSNFKKVLGSVAAAYLRVSGQTIYLMGHGVAARYGYVVGRHSIVGEWIACLLLDLEVGFFLSQLEGWQVVCLGFLLLLCLFHKLIFTDTERLISVILRLTVNTICYLTAGYVKSFDTIAIFSLGLTP
jgi:hypothetical protein